ncbi:7,8-dihydropteroate synthase [Legionella drozanskii LLAP-1]|uniref:Dihydropteroate synthase n=2 Tax=Legionellaceae TaxID=444 RepID=A0A0W0SXD8_9GAMM|nr:7,8-dihydropteroate synthase [Legionella drozanskii LLAP-1]PJE07306.1 MAG: dihydropteroate synthase [Legionella sp.]
MGVLNVTPDSFSDGGQYFQPESALERALAMIAQGADLIDIGGESTRPGSQAISCNEELSRVIPVIKQLRKESDICISIDTKKAQVMHEAVYAGASIINDISGFQSDESLAMAVELDVPLCLMHMQGAPQDMQTNPQYTQDVVDEINSFFQQRIETCLAAGIKRKNIILDPGFGFGKTSQHNMRIINQLTKFQRHNLPVMIGVSRKSTLGVILNTPVDKRLAGGLAVAVYSALNGVAMIRTHDIAETNQALTMVQAIDGAGVNNKARAT